MAVLGCLLSTGVRRLHCNAAALAGGQWRLQQGLAANPSGYGPLTELPDWSYAGERWPPCASYEGPASKKSPKGEVCKTSCTAVTGNGCWITGMAAQAAGEVAGRRKETE
ncbi:39S ribosomal protein L52, mitochondrial isoform X5 [Manis pentadactyla]|uniref:39S ribosomal protein L52, mitochondrial isoform X5 n=1 Tax=Manis pentadactyla TaxID=143292 RepID=UPI00255C9F01|nr:39S ribosomal protein L52, mitochondrial isoform X5 [Manis pentadactyla]